MRKINILYLLGLLFLMSSCYEDYVKDYDYSSVYFASQKPLRTVIADRGMDIKVGVAIGGKREVDVKDWADFEINPDLLEGTGLTLLPANYYTLSDPTTFRVSKSTLAVADVTISFTDDFYNDPNSMKKYYALPFAIKSSSLDKVLEGKESSIVAIKYISTYHGVYYVKGKIEELDATGTVVDIKNYSVADLSKNITRNVTSLSQLELVREGFANNVLVSNEGVKMTIQRATNSVLVEAKDGGINVTNGSGTFIENGTDITISLNYTYKKSGKEYRVAETLIRRQDPLKDLRFEEW